MVQLNMTTPYGVINIVKVTSVNIDPINRRIDAAVQYGYERNGNFYAVASVQYSSSGATIGIERFELYRGSSVVLTGEDYNSYHNYINQGKTPEGAVLQILVDRGILTGTIV